MARVTIIYVLLVATIGIITGCSGNADDSPQRERIEIPAALAADEKVQVYFETLEEVIDEYVTLIEKLAETSQEAQADGGEPGIGDVMNMLSDVGSSTVRIATLADKLDELEADAEILQADMTAEEIELFAQTYARIMTRFIEASENVNALP